MTEMIMADLGTTGAVISRVGIGTWAFGGPGWDTSWGRQDDRDSVGAIHRAVEQGVNWVDTAAVYGTGHAEEVTGRAVAQLGEGERPYVFTKCGLVWDEADRRRPPRKVLAPASIRRECEASLRRLGVERIDLYQCHWPAEDGTPLEETWATMAALVDEGKVRWIGVSNFDTAMLATCEAIRHVDTLQPHFSMLRREAGGDVLPWCAANGTGVIHYSPLASGLLTGRWSAGRLATLDREDWRRADEDFAGARLAANLDLVERVGRVAARLGCSVPELAIAWTLAWQGATGAIVGARNADQVDEWVGAPAVARRLGAGELDELAAAIDASGAGTGPSHPRAVAAGGWGIARNDGT